MNIELMLALLNQAANLISLVGSYLAQTSAEISADLAYQSNPDPLLEAAAIDYNVLGNQITTIGLAIYTIAGQIAINEIIAAANSSTSDNEESNTNNEAEGISAAVINDDIESSPNVWHVKKVKKLQRRRWRTIQHQK